jgi:hypothetical protein
MTTTRTFTVTDVKIAVNRDSYEKLTDVPQDFTVEAISMRTAVLQVAETLTLWALPLVEMDEELMVEVVATVAHMSDADAPNKARFIVDPFFEGDVDDKTRTYTGRL